MSSIDIPTGGSSSRKTVLTSLVGFSLLIIVWLAATSLADASGDFEIVYTLVVMAIIAGLQIYYIRRIAKEWDMMSTGEKWKIGIAAFTVPLLAVFLIAVAIVLALFFFGLNVFARTSSSTYVPLSGSDGSTSADDWHPDFGGYWGDDKVVSDSDGRPLRVGNDKVIYGPDGLPRWVGDRKVRYGADHRPAWIGDEKVVFGWGHDKPRWVGDREVR